MDAAAVDVFLEALVALNPQVEWDAGDLEVLRYGILSQRTLCMGAMFELLHALTFALSFFYCRHTPATRNRMLKPT